MFTVELCLLPLQMGTFGRLLAFCKSHPSTCILNEMGADVDRTVAHLPPLSKLLKLFPFGLYQLVTCVNSSTTARILYYIKLSFVSQTLSIFTYWILPGPKLGGLLLMVVLAWV